MSQGLTIRLKCCYSAGSKHFMPVDNSIFISSIFNNWKSPGIHIKLKITKPRIVWFRFRTTSCVSNGKYCSPFPMLVGLSGPIKSCMFLRQSNFYSPPVDSFNICIASSVSPSVAFSLCTYYQITSHCVSSYTYFRVKILFRISNQLKCLWPAYSIVMCTCQGKATQSKIIHV